MSTLTIACPSCGRRRTVGTEALGQKVQCACGMQFSVSPVFAVIRGGGWGAPAWWRALKQKLGAMQSSFSWVGQLWGMRKVRVVALAGLFVLFVGSAALAAWLMNRPTADDRVKARPKAEDPTPLAALPGAKLPVPDGPKTATPPVRPAPATELTPKGGPPPAGPPDAPAKADAGPTKSATPKVFSKTAEAPKDVAPPKTPAAPPPKAPLTVTPTKAARFWDLFDVAPEKARAQVGQVVTLAVRGKLERDARGQTYFGVRVVWPTPRTPAQFNNLPPRQQTWERQGYPANVRCYLAAGQVATSEELPPNADLTLRGVVVGRQDDPDVYMGYVVILRDCRLVR